jgi:hypothetical protein
MATVSKESYLRLMENRPYKFDEEEVNYRESESYADDRCDTCLHFYERVLDKFHTCEIFRPSDDSTVKPDWLCDFWTNGTTPTDKTSEPDAH